MPQPINLREKAPPSIAEEPGLPSGPVWKGAGKIKIFCSYRDSNPDTSMALVVAIPTRLTYSEPDKSNLYFTTHFVVVHFNIILPSKAFGIVAKSISVQQARVRFCNPPKAGPQR